MGNLGILESSGICAGEGPFHQADNMRLPVLLKTRTVTEKHTGREKAEQR